MGDKDKGNHESWCDCINKLSLVCNCVVSGYIDQLDQAQKEIEVLKADYGTCSAERDTLKEKLGVAEQVINRYLQRVEYNWDSQFTEALNKIKGEG